MLRSLRMKNFGCRAELSLDFTTGVVGIVGPNGCGKSTICDAIRLIFLGNVTRPGVKLDNINWKSGPRAHSYVAADLLIKGQEVSVERYLRGGKTSLTIHSDDGSEPVVVYGEVPVTDRLSALMGVSPKQLDDVCFQSQEELFGLVGAKRDRRLEFFQRLFDLAAAASGYQALGDALKQVVVSDESVATDQLRLAFEAAQARLESAEAERRQLPEMAALVEYQQQVRTRLAAIEAAQAAAEQLEIAKASLAEAAADSKSAAEARTVAESALQAIQSEDPERQLAAAQAAEAEFQHAAAAYQRYVTVRNRIEASVASLTGALAASPPVAFPAVRFRHFVFSQATGPSTALANRVEAEKARLLTSINAMVQGTVCPTCRTQLRDFDASLVAKLRRRSDRLARIGQQLGHSYQLVSKFSADCKAAADRVSQIQSQLAWETQAAERNSPVPAPQGDAAQLSRATNSWRQRVIDMHAARSALEQKHTLSLVCDQAVVKREAAVRRLEADAAAVSQEWLLLEPSLRESLAASEETARQIVSWESILVERRRAADEARQLWDESQARQRRNAKLQRLHDQLTRVRGYLHRESLPAIGVGRNIASIERMMNQMLLAYSADFSIEITSDLDLVAKFTDPETLEPLAVSSDRLSGGQKVTLALAFRLAAHAAIRHSCPLLVLDEPTAFLDKERIEGVYLVFEESRRIASAFHSQYIVVTHETALLPVFDQKIELGSLWSAPKA